MDFNSPLTYGSPVTGGSNNTGGMWNWLTEAFNNPAFNQALIGIGGNIGAGNDIVPSVAQGALGYYQNKAGTEGNAALLKAILQNQAALSSVNSPNRDVSSLLTYKDADGQIHKIESKSPVEQAQEENTVPEAISKVDTSNTPAFPNMNFASGVGNMLRGK